MASSKQGVEALGSTIADLSKSLANQLEALDQPEPSFAIDSPASLPQSPDIQGTRLKLLETLETLHHLVVGPSDFWFQQSMFLNHALLAFDVFNNFNFWDAVPLNGSASYSDISKSTNLPEQIVRRILRLSFTIFVFSEEAPGSDRVVHTAASAHIVRFPFVKSYLEHNMEDVRPAATVGVDALKKWFVGQSEPPEDVAACAIALATYDGHQIGRDLWYLLDNSERPGQPKGFRAKRFAEAMQGLRMTSGVMTESVLKQFDWGSLDEATVVDLGGSAGHISVILAENYPKLKLVVQDLASVQSAFDENINSTPYVSRIKFQAHDFFQPQVLPADVFLLKSVLHDWSDKYVSQIVRNLLDVLKPGNHLVVFDFVMPEDYDEETGSKPPLPVRKLVASMDMQMFVGCNSKERKVKDWSDVIKRADSRFELKEVHVPRGSPLGLLDFVFQG
ncbi:O-methyltransferase [Aspergillus vadensis CBS 113365]|uniref:O-methyltransferase n=1 Tax=Aspergillus vadensis (strain CBS 113365 / IMI 142717 / IBT 24658) TaxID=1448311 RepID=A0A319C697_ASPVC|nr:O-methyltransferase [Aspergillus vadensis CBS 113365]PYH64352.1 O-methyltransferase [Aspergillus vadensis CBS 113365]